MKTFFSLLDVVGLGILYSDMDKGEARFPLLMFMKVRGWD